MLAELVQKLVELGREGLRFESLQVPGDTTLVRRPDGVLDVFKNDRPESRVEAGSISAIIDWCDERINEGNAIRVYVSDCRIAAISNEAESSIRDRCVMELHPSKSFQALERWAANPQSPTAVVRMLRGVLAGACGDKVVEAFKRMNFNRLKSLKSSHDSMGKSVELAAQSAGGEIPERILFDVPLYDNVPSVKRIDVALTVCAESELVSIDFVGETVEVARQMVRAEIIDTLESQVANAVLICDGKPM